MSVPAVREQERTVVTRLRVVGGPLLRPVLCRVVSMVLTRADWPLDRLEEALLVCDALCSETPSGGEPGPTFSVHADEARAVLRLHDLSSERAERLLGHGHLPLVGNILERLADSVKLDPQTGTGACLTIALSAG